MATPVRGQPAAQSELRHDRSRLQPALFEAAVIGLLITLIAGGAALRIASYRWNTQLQGDVNLFALTAREFVVHTRLYYPMKLDFGPDAIYQALSQPAAQHPPLWPLLAGLLGKALGTADTFTMLKLLGESAGDGLLLLVAWRGWRRKQIVETAVAVALLASSPYLVDYSANGSPYILSAALVALAYLLLQDFPYENRWGYAAAGVLCGVAVQVHNVLVLLPLAFVSTWLVDRRRIPWRGLVMAALAGAVTVAPWFVWNWRHFGRLYYSYSTFDFLRRLGLTRTGIYGDAVAVHTTGAMDAAQWQAYWRMAVATAQSFGREYARAVSPFVLILAAFGLVFLLRENRRRAAILIMIYCLYALTIVAWALFRSRFLVPALPFAYLAAAAGAAGLIRRGVAGRTLACLALAGALAWNVAGLRQDPPTKYYADAAGRQYQYARMLDLSQKMAQYPRDVVLGYSPALDGGFETVYWQGFPFVYGREAPFAAVRKMAADFGARYIWTSGEWLAQVQKGFPEAREIMGNDVFHVLQMPDFQKDPAGSPLEAGYVRPLQPVRFGQLQLVGYAAQRWDNLLTLNFDWDGRGAGSAGLQYEVAVVSAAGQSLGNTAGPLGRWPDDGRTTWPADGALRQRVRLTVPWGADLTAARLSLRVVASSGEPLALSVGGAPRSSGTAWLDLPLPLP